MSTYLSLIGRRRGGRLLTFSAFRMGAYSRWALIRGWALIRINTVIEHIQERALSSLDWLGKKRSEGSFINMLSNKLKISLSSENARKINLYIKTGVSSFTGNFVLSSCTLSKKEDVIKLL